MIQLLDEKGFGSAEFIFVSLIVLLLIAGLSTLVSNEMNQTQTGDIAQTRITGEKIAEIINTVYIKGVGYTITLPVPTNTTVYVDDPEGFLTIYSSSNGANISIKVIPKNIQDATLNGGNTYNVTHDTNGRITFTQL
ncbi:MAG: hypothetical protein FGO69_11275 [Methanobacterium sp.]|nr:MAG: hypothetical protein FGO69_11275 [Methanobacterium sp.]